MRKFRLYHSFMSFYSKEFYVDVARNWKGAGMVYLILLALICAVPNTIKFRSYIKDMPEEIESVITQMPDIKIINGEVSIDETEPYMIMDPYADNKTLIIIDTTGKYKSLAGTSAQALITKTRLITKTGTTQKEYDLSSVNNFVLTKDSVRAYIKTLSGWIPIVAFPFVTGLLYILMITCALIFTLLGMTFSAMLKTKLDFKQLMRLSAMAITPVILTGIPLSFINFTIPFILKLLVSLGYLFLAVKVNIHPLQDPVETANI